MSFKLPEYDGGAIQALQKTATLLAYLTIQLELQLPLRLILDLMDNQVGSVQVETKNGELYRGELYEAEDNWNCQMRAVQMTGRVSMLQLCCDSRQNLCPSVHCV